MGIYVDEILSCNLSHSNNVLDCVASLPITLNSQWYNGTDLYNNTAYFLSTPLPTTLNPLKSASMPSFLDIFLRTPLTILSQCMLVTELVKCVNIINFEFSLSFWEGENGLS
jgi:hypothetical protein